MEHRRASETGPSQLSERERRALASIERQLRRDAPDLHHALRTRRVVRWEDHGLATSCVTAAGVSIVAAGLVETSVPVAFCGFVTTVLGSYGMTLHPTAGRLGRRLLRWAGIALPDGDTATDPHPHDPPGRTP